MEQEKRPELGKHKTQTKQKIEKSSLLFGLGVLKLMLGGIVLCSSASTIFMMLDSPDAPSPWPMFGLTCVRMSRYDHLYTC